MEDTEAYECPAGYYCMEGTAESIQCRAGTFSNDTRLRNETDCTPCTPGRNAFYTNLLRKFKCLQLILNWMICYCCQTIFTKFTITVHIRYLLGLFEKLPASLFRLLLCHNRYHRTHQSMWQYILLCWGFNRLQPVSVPCWSLLPHRHSHTIPLSETAHGPMKLTSMLSQSVILVLRAGIANRTDWQTQRTYFWPGIIVQRARMYPTQIFALLDYIAHLDWICQSLVHYHGLLHKYDGNVYLWCVSRWVSET